MDERAADLGLRTGMGIADARAMHPAIDVVEQDIAADRRLLEGLADWCDRYTPLVALEGTEGLFLDITGCAHLFGGERAMRDDMLTRLFHQGFAVCCGVASTPGAAWAASRHTRADPSPDCAQARAEPRADWKRAIVAPGREEALVAPLPLSALRLDLATRDGLESVGLRTVGAVLDTPRAPLARRFGKAVLLRLDQALGRVEESISPRLPVPPLSVERAFAEPLVQLEDIERLVLALGAALKQDLERRGEGARKLDLLLFRVDGVVRRISVGASRPLRNPLLMQRLFRERLATIGETIETGYGFDLIRLSAVQVARFDSMQMDLTGAAGDHGDDMALFADRVRARLGEGVLMRQAPAESHIPERAVTMAPVAAAMAKFSPATVLSAAAARKRDRPIRLFKPPEYVDVTAAEVPEGPPSHFRWRRAAYTVARAEGPERIAPEWWCEDDGQARDYFRVEDTTGRRYWLYREGFYGADGMQPRWYVHGMFA
ncbi:MAG TPA: DNA polymerase Y family protein [Mesorhizobium sp.]